MRRYAFLPLATYPNANSDAVAANAVRMAAHLDCGLHALALNADIPDISNPFAKAMINLPELIRQVEGDSKARGSQLLAKVEEEARNVGVEASTEAVRYLAALLPDIAATHARYYDVALCGWEAGNETSRLMAETVVFTAGRPVVLLPELSPVGSLDHIAVAWDGSRVAARAVADAEYLLRRARKISVLTVLDEKPLDEKDPGGRLAASLAKRGLEAEAIGIRCEDCPIESSLQDRAASVGAGILVMGAFGHSRLREFVLGGATRGVLSDLRMTVLLSH